MHGCFTHTQLASPVIAAMKAADATSMLSDPHTKDAFLRRIEMRTGVRSAGATSSVVSI
jgi:hypothetical protein